MPERGACQRYYTPRYLLCCSKTLGLLSKVLHDKEESVLCINMRGNDEAASPAYSAQERTSSIAPLEAVSDSTTRIASVASSVSAIALQPCTVKCKRDHASTIPHISGAQRTHPQLLPPLLLSS